MKRKHQPREVDQSASEDELGSPPAVYQNFFLKRDQMEVAESIVPGATERLLSAVERQQSHDHKMDEGVLELHRAKQHQERSDSWKAFVLVLAILAAVLFLLMTDRLAAAGILSGVFVGLAAIARVFRKAS